MEKKLKVLKTLEHQSEIVPNNIAIMRTKMCKNINKSLLFYSVFWLLIKYQLVYVHLINIRSRSLACSSKHSNSLEILCFNMKKKSGNIKNIVNLNIPGAKNFCSLAFF